MRRTRTDNADSGFGAATLDAAVRRLRRRVMRRLYHMKQRCYNPRRKDYVYYGAKGIGVCEEWRRSSSAFFEWYISALNEWYVKASDGEVLESRRMDVDRIDADGDYSPRNCRVVPHSENVKSAIRRDVNGRFSAHAAA